MQLKKKRLAEAVRARHIDGGSDLTSNQQYLRHISKAMNKHDLDHPEMERRMRAQTVWEYLDESKSTFYARMNSKNASFDPLFPTSIPSSSTGSGPKRWKLGAIVAWLRYCEAATNSPRGIPDDN